MVVATGIWDVVAWQRKELANDLALLRPEQWDTASLCSKWTVRDVLAHMTATSKMRPGQFVAKMAAAAFSFDRMTARAAAAERGASPIGTLEAFEYQIGSITHPPGPAMAFVAEAIIHAEDIRRPLGIDHHYPVDLVRDICEFYKDSNLVVGAKRRIAGLRLDATDADWTTGSGAEVRGPIMSLLMAMTGRRVAVDDLAGRGTELLRARL